jgi:F-type H+-transporting ATPase subunit epsilon
MEKALQVDIVTPQGSVYSGVVAAVTVPGTVAPFQVLYNHAPIISSLEPGIVKLLLADLSPRYYVVGGGFVEVLHNHVIGVGRSGRACRANRSAGGAAAGSPGTAAVGFCANAGGSPAGAPGAASSGAAVAGSPPGTGAAGKAVPEIELVFRLSVVSFAAGC